MTIAIIGAGMAGLACAQRLKAAGHPLALCDKGRAPGGRMSIRTLATPLGDASFDHGAQYFTARTPPFQAQLEAWCEMGIAGLWPAAGPDAFVGLPGMNAPVAHMALGMDVKWSTRVDALSRDGGGWRLQGDKSPSGVYDAVILAIPAEQAAVLLNPDDPLIAASAATTRSEPCWTLMAAFGTRLPVEADVLRAEGAIGWAARNNSKPGRDEIESWVIQAGPAWSTARLEDEPALVTKALLAAFAERLSLNVPKPLAASAHRWRYARSGSAGTGSLWNKTLKLGACGDWLFGPRVEYAWLSGDALAAEILKGF